MNRRGFTFVEIMTVITLVGILAAIALPRLGEAKRRAAAASVIGDFNAIRFAAFDQFSETGTYPPTGAWGVAPAELAPSLPRGFSFTYGDMSYRWRRWSLPNGMPTNPSQTVLLAVQVQGDARTIDQIRKTFRGQTQGAGSTVTLVIE